MHTKFPWYIAHQRTMYVVAGFVEYDDARLFIRQMRHDMYIIKSYSEIFD